MNLEVLLRPDYRRDDFGCQDEQEKRTRDAEPDPKAAVACDSLAQRPQWCDVTVYRDPSPLKTIKYFTVIYG
jgi:hypothetical protein